MAHADGEFAKFVGECCKRIGCAAKLARKMNVSSTSVHDWLCGNRYASTDHVVMLSQLSGISVSEIQWAIASDKIREKEEKIVDGKEVVYEREG